MFGLTTKFNKMQEVTIKHENPAIGNVLLAAGLRVRTKWGWKATVTEVVDWQFKFGQGVTVKREDDGKVFSLCPNDVDWACR
jgi:hypothetical protein